MIKTKMRLSLSDKLFYLVIYSLLAFCGLVVLLPLLNVFSQAFSDPHSVMTGRVLFWPRNFTLSTIWSVLQNRNIVTGYINTIFYASVGTVINIFLTVICAFPLSRKSFYGRNLFMLVFAFTMMFSGGMIPTYLVIRNLGLLDTRWVMLLPSAMVVWNMILARTFFQYTIPEEMYESAELDGASDIRVLISIVLPLSGPILAVLTLFYAVSTHWNSYFDAMMYLRSQRLFNIQLILRNAMANIESLLQGTDIGQAAQNLALVEASKYAIIVISMLPVLIIYPFVQRHFIRGIMIGAIKG